jgi:ubiquitin C-terminal hydrolase
MLLSIFSLICARLKNTGNSCYLNSVVQLLASLPFFIWELEMALKPSWYSQVDEILRTDDASAKDERIKAFLTRDQGADEICLEKDR